MTRRDFEDLLRRAEREGWVTDAEVTELRARFARGEITGDQLPLPLDEGIPDDITEEDVQESRDRLALVILLGVLLIRSKRRDELQDNLETRLRSISSEAIIPTWHENFRTAITHNILDQTLLGRGPAAQFPFKRFELAYIDDVIQGQAAYLSRFADERAIRALLARPMSEEAIAARSALYSGQGRAEWFKAAEATTLDFDWLAADEGRLRDAGWVVDYISRDDSRTCVPCNTAEQNGPYLPGTGPFPGEVCNGHGRCRCIRQLRFAPTAARRLELREE